MKIKSEILLGEIQKITENILHFAEHEMKELSDEKLNQKPAEDKWSIAECMEHLNRYGDYYIPLINEKINKSKTSAKEIFTTGWLGNKAAQDMLPKDGIIKNQMKTFKNMNPSFSEVNTNVLEEFTRQQKEILTIIEKAKTVDLNKNKIPITISRFIRFKLGDILRFLIFHNDRHFVQIKNVKKAL